MPMRRSMTHKAKAVHLNVSKACFKLMPLRLFMVQDPRPVAAVTAAHAIEVDLLVR
jgi:hypothetical protein